jgi:hypothetical protein
MTRVKANYACDSRNAVKQMTKDEYGTYLNSEPPCPDPFIQVIL